MKTEEQMLKEFMATKKVTKCPDYNPVTTETIKSSKSSKVSRYAYRPSR